MSWKSERPSSTVNDYVLESQHETSIRSRARVWSQPLVTLALILSDVLLALLVWLVAYALQSEWGEGALSTVAVAAVVPSVAVWVGIRLLLNLYPGYGLNAPERLRRHTYSVFATLAILAVLATMSQVGNLLSRLLLALGFAGLLLLAPLAQGVTRWGMWRLGSWGNPAVVIGYKDTSTQTVKLLKEEWGLGYNPVAVLDRGLAPSGEEFTHISPEESMLEAENIARHGVNTVIFAMPYTRRDELAPLVERASFSFRHVLIIPNLVGITNSAVTALDLAGTFAVEIKYNLLDPWALRTKRTLDLFGALAGGLFISPLLLVLVVLIKLDSPGPAFYGSLRRGSGGRQLRCWKFRTMYADADRLLSEYLRNNPDLRNEWERTYKLRHDPRITRVGHLLRKTSLDELPQLWNVLLGQMSLVGPRPMLEEEMPNYGDTYRLYKRVKPGITGLWQVSGRNNVSYKERIALNDYYVHNWSIWLDLVILARTINIVVRGRGAR